MNLNKSSRNFVGALRTTRTNSRVSFIDLYWVFPRNFRILLLPHKNTVIFGTVLWYYHRAWVTCGVNRKSVTRLSHVSILSRILIRFSRLLSARNRLIGIETGLSYLIFLISFIACRTCSPYIARVSRSKSASQCWREKRKKKKNWLLFCSLFLL